MSLVQAGLTPQSTCVLHSLDPSSIVGTVHDKGLGGGGGGGGGESSHTTLVVVCVVLFCVCLY